MESLDEIVEAIRRLSPAARRRLLRRLQASGLLGGDDLLTDRGARRIAPAVQPGKRADRSTAPVGPPADPERDQTYRSPVSGRIVVGSPAPEARDVAEMQPLPGQAPERPIGLVFDGGSRGNPGKGYGSYALDWPGHPRRLVRLQFGQNVTANEAEYDTLIAALEAVGRRLRDGGASPAGARLAVWGDSLLVINQVTGEWACREPRLRVRRERVRSLLAPFGSWTLRHQPREKSVEILGH